VDFVVVILVSCYGCFIGRRRWLSGTILASLVLDSTGFWVGISARTPIPRNITMGGDITGGFCPGAGFPSCHRSIYRVSEDNFCKNLDNSYFSLSLKVQVMVGTMEDGRYAINGKLWKVKKGYKQQRIACI
jgi:hypothetical protein